MLSGLLRARKRAKQKMVEAKLTGDVKTYELYHCRQLALKISANSIYGFTGTGPRGILPCQGIAETVTRIGRGLMKNTIEFLEKEYKCDIVYGDTDSIFIQYDVNRVCSKRDQIRSCFQYGEVLEKRINRIIAGGKECCMKIELEKVYYPMLLLRKKRYAGLKYESRESIGEVESKGLEDVRSDFCPFARETVRRVLSLILEQSECDIAEYIRSQLVELDENNVSVFDLSVRVRLKKTYNTYKLPPCTVISKMKSRRKDYVAVPGTYITYIPIVTKKGEKSKLYEKVEDAGYVEREKLDIDMAHIMTTQIMSPVLRIVYYSSCSKSVKELFRVYHKKFTSKNKKIVNRLNGIQRIDSFFTRLR
jgi:DNA polymerase delta subunit 1